MTLLKLSRARGRPCCYTGLNGIAEIECPSTSPALARLKQAQEQERRNHRLVHQAHFIIRSNSCVGIGSRSSADTYCDRLDDIKDSATAIRYNTLGPCSSRYSVTINLSQHVGRRHRPTERLRGVLLRRSYDGTGMRSDRRELAGASSQIPISRLKGH
jgi:hypothetical protein